MNEELKRDLDERMVGEEDEERRRNIQILRDVVDQFSGAVEKLEDHIEASQHIGDALKSLGDDPK